MTKRSAVFERHDAYPLAHDAEAHIETRDTKEADGGSLAFLRKIAKHPGNLCDILDDGDVSRIGHDAVREWKIDDASRETWRVDAEDGLKQAAQEHDPDDTGKDYPFGGAANVHYPILTVAAMQFNARALPELIKGDKVVGVRTFTPSPPAQSGAQMLPASGSTPALAQPLSPAPAGPSLPEPPQQGQQPQQPPTPPTQRNPAVALDLMRQQRAARVAQYLNFLIFYKMDNWEGETDLLTMQAPITGQGFKKVYMGPDGLESDYVSALRLTVSNDTRSLQRCPRVTQDFDIYPYEAERGMAAGNYRRVTLAQEGDDPQRARLWIEQHRMEDLDGDGMAEPYIVTVDVETEQVLRIEAAFVEDDVKLDDIDKPSKTTGIDRWAPFASYQFMPDPKGGFYGCGLARLLRSITDVIDTTLNQTIDAAHAEIAGGGFIASGVRLQGSGQAGALYFQPGEYKVVATPGGDLRQAIWERTVPHPSAVGMQMLEMLLAAAKDVASVKDVVTGASPATAPVGTTMALQNQALTEFSAIYKRFHRGFRDEFRLMFQCVRRWATDNMRHEYAELTGGDLGADFSGDGTDIQPVADPAVVTKLQKMTRFQALIQLAESPVGMAAGMQTAAAAQAIAIVGLEAMEWDTPDRFLGDVPPNPELIAKVQEIAASTALKQADAQLRQADTQVRQSQVTWTGAKANLDNARTVEIMGDVGERTHRLHQETARTQREGLEPPEHFMPTPAPGSQQ